MNETIIHPSTSPEQVRYAAVLEAGRFIGLGLLLTAFILTVTGLVKPAIPLDELPRYWGLSATEYHEAVNAAHLHRATPATGWAWVQLLHRGDFLSMLGVAALALVTIGCYVAVLPMFVRRRDRVYVGIVVLEIAVLLFSATGLACRRANVPVVPPEGEIYR